MEVLGFIIFLIFVVLAPILENRYNHSTTKGIKRYQGVLNEHAQKRLAALAIASLYIKPYNDIFGRLELSNKYCNVHFYNNRIHCYLNGMPDIYFRITKSNVYSYDELWNMLCYAYEYNTSYQGLIEFFKSHACEIAESGQSKLKSAEYGTFYSPKATVDNLKGNKSSIAKNQMKVDINNCSEIEMTELPGINVIMSKRAIKKREEIGGFKKIEDFFLYLHIKPHMEKQLRERICLNKMKGTVKLPRNTERSVDL